MKQIRMLSSGSSVRLVCFTVLLGFYCLTPAYPEEQSQKEPPDTKNPRAAAPLLTFTPKPVDSIVVEGVTYDLQGASRKLLVTLSSDNDKLKRELLREMGV